MSPETEEKVLRQDSTKESPPTKKRRTTPTHADDEEVGPDVGTADPTDSREHYDWKSKYPVDAQKKIKCEAWYLVAFLLGSLALIFLTWRDMIAPLVQVPTESYPLFKKYCYYSFSALLGGTTFATKYLYRVVGRGWWHEDRRLWRFLSPFVALSLGFAFGTLVDGNFMSVAGHSHSPSIIAFGFLIGYFADDASGKLHELASVLFGHTARKTKEHSRKSES